VVHNRSTGAKNPRHRLRDHLPEKTIILGAFLHNRPDIDPFPGYFGVFELHPIHQALGLISRLLPTQPPLIGGPLIAGVGFSFTAALSTSRLSEASIEKLARQLSDPSANTSQNTFPYPFLSVIEHPFQTF